MAALVPKPRVNLTRFYGVFAPNSKHRALLTPAGRGKDRKVKAIDDSRDRALSDWSKTTGLWGQFILLDFEEKEVYPT